MDSTLARSNVMMATWLTVTAAIQSASLRRVGLAQEVLSTCPIHAKISKHLLPKFP
jgi:hypothetical protein